VLSWEDILDYGWYLVGAVEGVEVVYGSGRIFAPKAGLMKCWQVRLLIQEARGRDA